MGVGVASCALALLNSAKTISNNEIYETLLINCLLIKILCFAALCVSALIFTGCTSFGTKYSPDKEHEVYYKGSGLDESTAKKLFDYLKANGYFADGHKATVQIEKAKDTVSV